MEKSAFRTHRRYAVTLQTRETRLRPANLYVHLLEESYMITRHTSGPDVGLLVKLRYDDVVRIVRAYPVRDKKRFLLPEAMLEPKFWETRDSLRAYSSAAGLGQ